MDYSRTRWQCKFLSLQNCGDDTITIGMHEWSVTVKISNSNRQFTLAQVSVSGYVMHFPDECVVSINTPIPNVLVPRYPQCCIVIKLHLWLQTESK